MLACFETGGVAIYSVPFIWHLHEEPRDFSGFWVTFGQLFVYNIYRFNRGPLRYIPVIPVLGLAIQGMSYLLDKIDKTEQWTWMYLIVVRKPE